MATTNTVSYESRRRAKVIWVSGMEVLRAVLHLLV